MSDLSSKIFKVLNQLDSSVANKWLEVSKDLQPSDDGRMLIKINQFFRIKFGLLPVNTINIRECLNDSDTETAWLHNFKKYVAPYVVEYGVLS